jgi:putative membrane protein
MVTAIVVAARFIEPLLTDYPELTRAAFFGMILASIAIPLAMAGLPMRPGETLLIVLVAGGVFTALGLPAGSVTEPAWWAVMLSAAVAVCALVLPGVSGSFLLLTLGLYDDTIAAVNNRNLEYLGLFFLGALVGVSSFVLLLQWLLHHARRLTLIVMTGLLLGSLRALWPWQSESRELLAAVPGEIGAAVVVGLAGAAVVLALMGLERLIRRG